MISLVSARNVLQHEIGIQNEAETARNPYFTGLNIGDPSRSNTPNEIKGMVWQTSLSALLESKGLYVALETGLPLNVAAPNVAKPATAIAVNGLRKSEQLAGEDAPQPEIAVLVEDVK